MAWTPKTELHSLLARQLKRHRDTDDIPETWRPFLDAVNEAYRQGDADRQMIERSLDLSSQEMQELIQELQKSKREKEYLIKELEAKNKEMEHFTYAVTHDLKAPLVTIRGFLLYLKQDAQAGNTERLEKDFQQIQTAATQMGKILEELLELTRAGKVTSDPEEVALVEVAREAASLVAGQIAAQDVQVHISPDLPRVRGERPRLLQVFQNLIDNAVKFMGDQAEPRIDIFVRHADGQHTASRPVCCVRDNGQGINPLHHKQIFGLFDRLSTDGKGTGIGLALVKRVVDAYGGKIWVESEGPGTGSTFCLSLPVA